jgi:hypothetical protein
MTKNNPPINIEDHIRKVVDAAPPLTPRQRDVIGSIYAQSDLDTNQPDIDMSALSEVIEDAISE